MNVHDLPTPCLLLDLDRLRRNCERMLATAQRAGVRLRPHLKTLKSHDAARLAMDHSASITVSTLHEAAWFARHGFRDITCAVCLPPARAAAAWAIHRGIDGPGLGVLLDDLAAARETIAVLSGLGGRLPVWIEVDCGEHRTGVDPDGEVLLPLAHLLAGADAIELRGVLTHGGPELPLHQRGRGAGGGGDRTRAGGAGRAAAARRRPALPRGQRGFDTDRGARRTLGRRDRTAPRRLHGRRPVPGAHALASTATTWRSACSRP